VNVTPTKNGARLLGALSLLTLLGVVAGCGGGDEPAHYEPKTVAADLATVERTTVPRLVTATGALEAQNAVEVSTRLMGQVREVLVRSGERVEAGQILVRIDDTDMAARKRQAEAAIAEAQAVLDNAETTQARFERLYAENSVSKSQLDDVRTARDRAFASLTLAEANLAEVEVQLGYLNIASPTAGAVTQRLVDPGDMASPGQPLVTLEQNNIMKVRAGISERDIDLVDVGGDVRVTVTSLDGAIFDVPVARVLPAANPMSRTFDLEAYLPNDDGRLRSGMFARVEVSVGTREAILVPADALHTRGQLTGVWIVNEAGVAHLRWIRVGRIHDGMAEVISGLHGGETIVRRAEQPLVEGDRIEGGQKVVN
jgi:RND family efflux transporter MFP subunit